jgi:hypothetical protein
MRTRLRVFMLVNTSANHKKSLKDMCTGLYTKERFCVLTLWAKNVANSYHWHHQNDLLQLGALEQLSVAD